MMNVVKSLELDKGKMSGFLSKLCYIGHIKIHSL